MANQKSTKPGEEGPAARVGALIKGKWKVEGLLGVGGMAAVYAAAHRNGQRAALKILHADFAREKTICDRFLREAYVSNKVNHSATVQVLDDDTTEQGEPFLIMELLEGETVRDAWKKSGRTMPVGRVLQICERVLDCLASCHAIKVIHRDLKPANIFITNEDEIKVLDFGVAQMREATSERTATGTALGTPAYMSPEQAMGLVDQLDGRADLFSVGAMMHALITGHRINNGRTEQEALVMAATKPVPSVARIASQLPIELIKAIDKALAWDRRNRFQDSREMQKGLIDLMPANGVGALPAKPPPRPNEPNLAAPAPEPPPNPAAAAPAHSAHQHQHHQPHQPPPAPAPANKVSSPGMPAIAMPQSQQHPHQASMQPPHAKANASLASMPAVQAPLPGGVGAPPPAFDPLLGFAPPVAPQQSPQIGHAPAGGTQLGDSAESDPRVQGLRDLMKHFDRLLPSVRQLGWPHPATERTLRTAYDAFVDALKANPDLASFTLRPYSFMTLGHTVWEPNPPYDAIPYNLFAAGVRSFKIEAGVTLDEMRELLGLLLMDPGRDLPPEDDIVAALWEKAFPHVKYECADAFAEGDAAERERFYADADQLEQMAEAAARNNLSRIEAQAMALSTDDAALGKQKEKSPFALDDAMRNHFLPFLDIPRELWAERYVDALVEGYLDAAANRDAPLVLASLRKSSADLVVANRLGVAVQINQAVIDRLRARVQQGDAQSKLSAALTNAMFGGETLELILKRLREDPSGLEVFAPILATLTANEFPIILAALRTMDNQQVRAHITQYIERYAHGRENELAQAAPGSDPDSAAYLVQLLGRMASPPARQALQQLQNHEDVNVRVEARILAAPSADHAQNELASLLDNASPFVRMAAVRAISRYTMRAAWPTVARIINGKTFNELGNDERRELLRACLVLAPDRGEPVLLDIAKKGGVLMSEGREASRALAAELLGDLSRNRQVAMALQEIANGRWGISEETRTAAANAAKKIGLRLAQAHQQGQGGGSATT